MYKLNKLVYSLLFSISFLSVPLAFAQSSDSGVLVSPPIQDQGSNEGNTGNGGNVSNSGNTKHQQQTNSTTSDVSSQNSQNSTSAQKYKVPPQYAIDACQDKAEGDACEMTTEHGTRAGICANTPDKKYLFCRHNRKRTHSQRNNENISSS